MLKLRFSQESKHFLRQSTLIVIFRQCITFEAILRSNFVLSLRKRTWWTLLYHTLTANRKSYLWTHWACVLCCQLRHKDHPGCYTEGYNKNLCCYLCVYVSVFSIKQRKYNIRTSAVNCYSGWFLNWGAYLLKKLPLHSLW